jgi:osmotically-inducible protein OsmY
MAETTSIERTDEDILQDLHQMIRSYKPLIASRPYFRYSVHNNVVKVEGNIKSGFARQIFSESIPDLPGVMAVDDSELYDDEALRLALGKLLPVGVRVRIDHGHVILTGRLAPDIDADALKAMVGEVPGVREVLTDFA